MLKMHVPFFPLSSMLIHPQKRPTKWIWSYPYSELESKLPPFCFLQEYAEKIRWWYCDDDGRIEISVEYNIVVIYQTMWNIEHEAQV